MNLFKTEDGSLPQCLGYDYRYEAVVCGTPSCFKCVGMPMGIRRGQVSNLEPESEVHLNQVRNSELPGLKSAKAQGLPESPKHLVGSLCFSLNE